MSAWSENEVEAAVSDYMSMLSAELQGADYNKAEHNRRLRENLDGRSKGSVERKHQNISAVLLELEMPYIDGYKPLGNYQRIVREVVRKHLSQNQGLLDRFTELLSVEPEQPSSLVGFDDILVDAPELVASSGDDDDLETRRIIRKYNFPDQDARNRRLGKMGEQFVLDYEKARLARNGMEDLVNEVEWVSQTQGDGAGYDISSFDNRGERQLIEVKTTTCGRSFPFLVSRNEVRVSEERADEYCLYRLFQFRKQPRLFMLPGAISSNCLLEPKTFKASFGRGAA